MPPLQTRTEAELKLAAEVLRSFGEVRFVARGSSMLPGIYPGDLLTVSRVTPASVRAGHVVLVSRDGHFCAHRVVCRSARNGAPSLVTRGDAVSDEDPPVSERELIGRVTGVMRGRKRIELPEKLGLGRRILAWAARNSEAMAAWLLRWHLLRTRIERRTCVEVAKDSNKLVECL